jgi:hypothetical protein
MLPSLNRTNPDLWERDSFCRLQLGTLNCLDWRCTLTSVAVIVIVLVGSGLVAHLWYEGLLHQSSTRRVDSIVRWRL